MLSIFRKKKQKNKPLIVTESNFNEKIFNSNQIILLDFHATWCQPCQVMSSLISRLAKDEDLEGKILIGKVDIDANPTISKHFSIRSVPTLLFIYNNKVYERQTGLLAYNILKDKCLSFCNDVSK